MPIYNYRALKKGKERVAGQLTAQDIKDAKEILRSMGCVPLNIEMQETLDSKKDRMTSLSLKDKIDFISTLQILLSSGIPVVEALMFMENEAAKKNIRKISGILKQQIMGGATIASTMAAYPQIFGHIFIGLVKAGEEAGELEKTLGRIKDLLTKEEKTKSKVIGTLMYPIFVIVLACIIVLIMLIFVFPKFQDMFAQQEKELPFITQIMIDAGNFLKEFWYTIPFMIFAVIAFCYTVINWAPARRILDIYVLKIPFINNLILFSNFSNFMSVFSVSYDAGIPIVDCLHLAVITLTNSVVKDKMKEATVNIQKGLQVSQAFKATAIVPKMLLFMLSTGEESGRLGDMLEKAVNYLDKILDGIIDVMTKMIEPVMLLVIGGIVMVMALALYLPLFQSYAS